MKRGDVLNAAGRCWAETTWTRQGAIGVFCGQEAALANPFHTRRRAQRAPQTDLPDK